MNKGNEDYAEGLRDGKIQAIENMQKTQNDRLNNHSKRLSTLEKASYMVLGMILWLELAPALKEFFLTK